MFSWFQFRNTVPLAAFGILALQPAGLGAACPDSPPEPTVVLAGTSTPTDKNVGPLSGDNSVAQTFTAPGEGCVQLQSIAVSLLTSSGSAGVFLRVYQTSGGLPDFSEPLSPSVDLGVPSNSYAAKTANFAPALQLQGGQLYAFVLSTSAGSSSGYQARAYQGDIYSGGMAHKGGDGDWEDQSNRDLVMTLVYSCCPLPNSGCTYSQGYWKNHAEAWPVDSLDLGARTYDKDELLSIFAQPVRGNGLISLSYQLIAAILNQENGASAPLEVESAVGQSSNLVGTQIVPPVEGSDDWVSPDITGSYTSLLDEYNNGIIGPGHCTE